MTIIETSLDDLRWQIDGIDDQLHDLLMARAAVVEEIGRRKSNAGSPVMHPAREAAILRRLAERHSGPFPFGAVARIWREMIGTFAYMQHPFTVAVLAAEDQPGTWDIARDHYGSRVPMLAYRSAGQVIGAVAEGSAVVGILPFPAEQDDDHWWLQLLSRDPGAPRITARLPFARRGNARGAGDVLAIAAQLPDFAGFDRSLIAVEFPTELSRTRLLSSFAASGLSANVLALDLTGGLCIALAEIAGPITPADPRLTELAAQFGKRADGVCYLGGYAEPLTAASPRQPAVAAG